jgi:hypothetical protein
MKKLILFLAISMALVSTSAAQDKEKVVTGSVTLMTPVNVKVLDEYLSSQLYTGGKVFSGLNVKLGAIYKKQENLSWDVYFTGFNRPQLMDDFGSSDVARLENPAKSQNLKYSAFSVGYGTYYNWLIGKKLKIKAGGMFDVYGAMKKTMPDGVNNGMNIDAQMMIKAHAGIKYGWDFKKWGLDLHGTVTLPVVGLIAADHPSEPSIAIVGNNQTVLNPAFRHIFLGSYHNYMSVDYELGIDFVFRPLTLTLGFGSSSKWWKVYDIQNIRQIDYLSIGMSFDMVSRNRFKSSNRNF